MAQYSYNGQILIKNSKREDYRFACIEEREDGKIVKIQISSTFDGAGAEKRRYIAQCREGIENFRRAIKAIENGRDSVTFNFGRYSERRSVYYYKKYWNATEEEKAMNPIDYFNRRIEENEKAIDRYEKEWIIVPVEKA